MIAQSDNELRSALGACDRELLHRGGRVSLSDVIREGARQLARADFEACEAEEFAGDEVRDIELPAWLGDISLVFPTHPLRELGLQLRFDREPHLYATCGVDEHIDDIDGLSVCVVLHSDGFRFRSSAGEFEMESGQWFIFDDRLAHEVIESERSSSLLALTVPIEHANGCGLVERDGPLAYRTCIGD